MNARYGFDFGEGLVFEEDWVESQLRLIVVKQREAIKELQEKLQEKERRVIVQ